MGEQVQEPDLYAYPPTRAGSYLIWGHEGPRCFHSPSWHQVTADCGRGPVLQETPAAAPTGWKAWRCCCGDWWPWKRWPHRGLGCNALMGEKKRDTDGLFYSSVVSYSYSSYVGQRDGSVGACCEQRRRRSSQPPALWLHQRRAEQTNTLTRPPALSAAAQPRPPTVHTHSLQQIPSRHTSATDVVHHYISVKIQWWWNKWTDTKRVNVSPA